MTCGWNPNHGAIEIRFVFAYTAVVQPCGQMETDFGRSFPKMLPAIHKQIASSIAFAFLTEFIQPTNRLGNY
jgi:hypothetical protein